MINISNDDPTNPFVLELNSSEADLDFLSDANIYPGLLSVLYFAYNKGGMSIPKIYGSNLIKAEYGATIIVKSFEVIPKLIANNGIIIVDNKFQPPKKTDIEISNNGSINLTGYNLVKTIHI